MSINVTFVHYDVISIVTFVHFHPIIKLVLTLGGYLYLYKTENKGWVGGGGRWVDSF